MPNSERLRRAFDTLDLLVCLDIQLSETASQADYVLPCTSPLQRPDLPFIFPLMLGLQRRPYLQATRAVVPPQGEQRDEATIYLDLARACKTPLWGSRVAQRAFELLRWQHSRRHPAAQPALPQEALLSLLLRLTGQGSFEKLLQDRHGRLRPPHRGEDFLGKRVVTDDGKVHLAPAVLLTQARARLEVDHAAELERRDTLKLITRRHVTTHNSWTHNVPKFVAGDRGGNYLYMHPEDLAARGITDGDMVDVRSATAVLRVPVQALADLMPGTAALPHGWGHQRAGQAVARATRGVNANLLAADGPERLERVSGMAHLTGIPGEVSRATGPQYTEDWSGLSPAERGEQA
jgi:formate dehydrogenase